MIIFGELAISVRVQIIEPISDLGGQQIGNRHISSSNTRIDRLDRNETGHNR
jgi:hypothetical protein